MEQASRLCYPFNNEGNTLADQMGDGNVWRGAKRNIGGARPPGRRCYEPDIRQSEI